MNDVDCIVRESELTSGDTRLHCRAIEPSVPVIARLAIIHGYGEHCARYVHFMKWLAQRGVASVAFDQRGHGLSTGRRGFVQKWEEYLTDVQTFLASIESNELPLFILAHSHGGLVCAAAAERGIIGTGDDAATKVRGCILTSPYLAARVPPPIAKRLLAGATNHIVPWLRVSSGLQRHWLSSDAEMVAQDHADKLLNRSATPRWFYTMRRAQTRVQNEVASFKLPLLCLIGGADVIPDPAVTAKFVEQAGSVDKSFYRYADRVHELLRDVGREKVFADIFGWIKARI